MVKPTIARKKKRAGGEVYAAHLDRQQLKPSERANMDFADSQSGTMLRPMIPVDIPFLYRVFIKTVQRVPLHYSSLNSAAAYILVCDEDREAVGWYGSDCSLEDRKYATELGLQVLRLDLRKYAATHFPFNSEANENFRILRYILPKLWSDEATYRTKKSVDARRKPLYNAPVSIGCMDKYLDGSVGLREVAFASSDEAGGVPRLAFVPIKLNTVAVVNYADQWDLWIARGVTAPDEKAVLDYIMRLSASRSGNGLLSAMATVAKNPNVRVVRQGCERVLFRETIRVLTDFEPPGKTVAWTAPQPVTGGPGMLGMVGGSFGDSVNAIGRFGGVVGDAFSLDTAGRAFDGVMGAFSFGGAGSDAEERERGMAAGGGGPMPPHPPSAAERKNSGVAGAGAGAALGGKSDGARPASAAATSRVSMARFFSRSSAPPPADLSDAANAEADASKAAGPALPPPNKAIQGKSRGAFVGRDMLSHDMMDFHDALSVGASQSRAIIDTVAYEPVILVGYQVEIDEGPYAGRYVVTGVKKSVFQKSLFRLSNFEGEDEWVKLKRGTKAGLPFRVLRRVFDPN